MATETRETAGLIGSDKVEGTYVYDAKGEHIGSIERVMIEKVSGQVAYAVLNFGGFLGLGQRHYPVPWSRLQYDPVAGAYQLDLSEAELKHGPQDEAGAQFDWGDREDPIVVPNYHHKPTYWGVY